MIRFWLLLLFFCAGADSVHGFRGDTWTIIGGIFLVPAVSYLAWRYRTRHTRRRARRRGPKNAWLVPIVLVSTLGIIPVWIGLKLGAPVRRRISPDLFRTLVILMLMASGALLIARAL